MYSTGRGDRKSEDETTDRTVGSLAASTKHLKYWNRYGCKRTATKLWSLAVHQLLLTARGSVLSDKGER